MGLNCHTFLETIEATDLLSQRVANLLDTIFQRSPKKGDTVCDHFMCSYSCGEKDPQQGREAAAPSNIREIQEIQGGQEAPHNGDAIGPIDA